MKYTYYFKDSSDVIINDGLTRKEYPNFIKELKEINSKYDYQIYLGGGYLQYITMTNENYTDIDFFIMSEKIVDLFELTDFFKQFHQLAKKYSFAYDLIYFMDANSNDLNMNPKIYQMLNVQETRTIKLYSKKVSDKNNSNTHNYMGKLVPNTELFEGKFTGNLISNKYIIKIQRTEIFQKPLKIS